MKKILKKILEEEKTEVNVTIYSLNGKDTIFFVSNKRVEKDIISMILNGIKHLVAGSNVKYLFLQGDYFMEALDLKGFAEFFKGNMSREQRIKFVNCLLEE